MMTVIKLIPWRHSHDCGVIAHMMRLGALLVVVTCLAASVGCGADDSATRNPGSRTDIVQSSEMARDTVRRIVELVGGDQARALLEPAPTLAFHLDADAIKVASSAPVRGSTARAADVWLPRDAAGIARVGERTSGMTVAFRLLGAKSAPAAITDGLVVYRGSFGPDAGIHGSVVHRSSAEGTEDFVFLARAPAREMLAYRVELSAEVAGLRLVANCLELLAEDGVPRLRVPPPYVLSSAASGSSRRIPARLAVRGCKVDRSTADPRGRKPTPPGSRTCDVMVSWDGAGVTYPALVDPAWTTTGSMTVARAGHTLTALADGRALAVGGGGGNTAEIYDPVSGTWATTASPSILRTEHRAVRLMDGRVLVAGGYDQTVEIYDPAAPTPGWSTAGALAQARRGATMTLLTDGKVLVAGGTTSPSAELFDPAAASNPWSAAGTMIQERRNSTAALLPDGRVLVAGGTAMWGGTPTKTTEIYDPNASGNPWSSAGTMSRSRYAAGALLAGNRLFMVGGIADPPSTVVDVFDSATGTWFEGPPLNQAVNSAIGLGFPSVGLMVRTSSTNEWYDSVSEKWWVARPDAGPSGLLALGRTVLANGKGLFSGGNIGTSITNAASLFDPAASDALTGGACTTADVCKSGVCADNVCCDAACSGCMSCVQAHTGKPSGTCSPVLAGKDFHNACLDDGSPACNLDGFCDGAGACQKYPVTSGCMPSLCSSGIQCASGFCVDGICCDSACTGKCQACKASLKGQGVDGVCGFIADGSDPQSECPVAGSGPCAGNGVCNGSGDCRLPTEGNVCGTTSCIGIDAMNDAPTCSAGTCTPGGVASCYPYLCSALACLTSCTSSAQCAAGLPCVGGQCTQLKGNGLACSDAAECTSGICVEGVCCNSICDAECDSCLAATKASGSSGACGPRKAGAACGTTACVNATTLGKSACDGLGACVTLQVACTPYACVSGACNSNCTLSTDCAVPYVCVASGCTTPEGGSGGTGGGATGGASGTGATGGTAGAGGTSGDGGSTTGGSAGSSGGQTGGASVSGGFVGTGGADGIGGTVTTGGAAGMGTGAQSGGGSAGASSGTGGAAGAGGAAGFAGTSAGGSSFGGTAGWTSGGAAGSSGIAGTGGPGGGGGAGGASGSAGDDAGLAPGDDPLTPEVDGGCGCRQSSPRNVHAAFVVFVVGLLLTRRRRRD
jgi:hypothetical protein